MGMPSFKFLLRDAPKASTLGRLSETSFVTSSMSLHPGVAEKGKFDQVTISLCLFLDPDFLLVVPHHPGEAGKKRL